jgi:hypothetical protein
MGGNMIGKNIIRLVLVSSIGVSLGYPMNVETELEGLRKERATRLKERCDLAKNKFLADDDILEKDTTKDTVYSKWIESAEIAAKSWNMSFDDYFREAKAIVSQYSNSYRGPKSYLNLVPTVNPYSEIKEDSKEFQNLKNLCANLKSEVNKEELEILVQKQQQTFPKFIIPM